jgi:hypothetical protein
VQPPFESDPQKNRKEEELVFSKHSVPLPDVNHLIDCSQPLGSNQYHFHFLYENTESQRNQVPKFLIIPL